MEHVWFSAALWLVLALVATLLSIWFRISTALSEIVVGTGLLQFPIAACRRTGNSKRDAAVAARSGY
jgi:hypothetical protein